MSKVMFAGRKLIIDRVACYNGHWTQTIVRTLTDNAKTNREILHNCWLEGQLKSIYVMDENDSPICHLVLMDYGNTYGTLIAIRKDKVYNPNLGNCYVNGNDLTNEYWSC